MNERRPMQITSRKKPRQARSKDLVAAILQAALQVLAREGARRFTTTRVAERAGVSVGSIYQYFPNKAAILFRLQSDEWRETAGMLRSVLDDPARPPLERLRRLVHAFVKSECDEAALRMALNDAAPLYRDAPEAKAVHASSKGILQAFMRETLPDARPAARTLAGALVKTTLSAVAKEFSEAPRTPRQVAAWSDAIADMLAAYLVSLGHVAPAPAARRRRTNA